MTTLHQERFVRKLTGRQKQLAFMLIDRALRDKEMERELSLTFSTIRFHMQNLFEKLGVTSRTEAVVKLLHTDDWRQ